jgi:hypothetical protein
MVIRADWLLKADGTMRTAASATLMTTLSSTVLFHGSARRVRRISVALVKLKGTRVEAKYHELDFTRSTPYLHAYQGLHCSRVARENFSQ